MADYLRSRYPTINPNNFSYSRFIDERTYTHYASAEFTTTSGIIDYDIASETELFSKITMANEILIRIYGDTATIKLNNTAEDEISIPAGGSFLIQNFQLSNMYITASGNITAKLFMLGYK